MALSGGIWLLWDNGKINIEIMDTNSLSIAANHIIDLGQQGCYCTWTNKMTKERLDGGLCNGDQ